MDECVIGRDEGKVAQRTARLLSLHVAFCHSVCYLVSFPWSRLPAAISTYMKAVLQLEFCTYNERDDDTSLPSTHLILGEYFTARIQRRYHSRENSLGLHRQNRISGLLPASCPPAAHTHAIKRSGKGCAIFRAWLSGTITFSS
ncbi:hypothetical protein V8C44DRAFT_326989 [Trichoderma aethiopicum]